MDAAGNLRASRGPIAALPLRCNRRPVFKSDRNTYIAGMNINLPADQERWLQNRIAKGEFQSAEDAVRQLIAERMIVDDDDMAWARPLVDEARAAVARGDKSSLEEAELDIDRVLASLER